MDNELVLFSLKDREKPEVDKLFTQLKTSNDVLYRFLISELQKDSLLEIRKDILDYIAENAANFGKNHKYMFNLAGIICNIKIMPEHIEWIDSYLKRKENLDNVDDFFIMFSEAVERNMPLNEIKKLFEKETDELIIYDKILNYNTDTAEIDGENMPNEEKVNAKEIAIDAKKSIANDNKTVYEKRESDYAEMFHSLITVMSKKDDSDNEVYSVDDNFKKIAAKFQLATSELIAYASEVVHAMECKREENERLNALLTIQQRVLSGQQDKINELRMQIANLNSRIQNAEKKEMRRKAIDQKISELQNLTINEHKDGDYSYLYDFEENCTTDRR